MRRLRAYSKRTGVGHRIPIVRPWRRRESRCPRRGRVVSASATKVRAPPSPRLRARTWPSCSAFKRIDVTHCETAV